MSNLPSDPHPPAPKATGMDLSINPAWEVHPAEVKAAVDRGEALVLLDVRRPDEWEKARIPGAVLIPLHELGDRIDELAEQQRSRVVVYCHHGARSLRGAAILRQYGFTNAHSMAGGIDAYTLIADPTIPRYR
jgi:rhodanese-related sulfurtransferase